MTGIDIAGYASIDRLSVASGEEVESIGGAAIYAALAAVRMGVTPRILIAVGDDFPDAWLHRLAALGIDTRHIQRRAGPTRRTRLIYDATEERCDSAARNDDWWTRTEALAPPVPDTVAPVCLLCPMPPERVGDYRARTSGVLIADTSEVFAAPGPRVLSLFHGVDIFAPSLDEAALLTGETQEARIEASLSKQMPVLILKRGARGLLHVRGNARHSFAAARVRAIDPTGAGDAALGAIAAAVAMGLRIPAQLAAGAAAGALAVSGIGPTALGWTD